MSNGIAVRQNEEKAIVMLAAQRQLYNDAKTCRIILDALSVLVPVVMSLISVALLEESILKSVPYILSIVSMLFSFFADKHIADKKRLAAIIQQKFDIYVYNMSWNERLFGKDKNVIHEIIAYSKQIIANADEKEKLYNWYTPAVDKRDLATGILLCQRETFGWDSELRKRYRLISIIIIAFLCFFVFLIGLWNHESVEMLVWRLAFIAPMLNWFLTVVKALNKDMERLKELDGIINNDEPKTMDELEDIQKKIFEHRKECYVIPNFVYQMFKCNDEDTAKRIVSLENKD